MGKTCNSALDSSHGASKLSDFMFDLDELFTSAGPLARSLPGYVARPAQRRMAARIATAIAERETLLVEAGTGTGKTFAYLVPALLSGRRVIISTGTRTLQDQLHAKDLPLVARALGRPARVALLKGRANYLCRHRLGQAASQMALDGFEVSRGLLGQIERWARVTASGDLAEVPALNDTSPLRADISSTRDNCLGQRCREFSACHVVAARRAASEADIVVVNHHLLLADLALKEDGFGDLLGSADAVILDEAHQLPDLATQFFGTHVSSRQVEHLLTDVRTELTSSGVGLAEAGEYLARIEQEMARAQASMSRLPARVDWAQVADDVQPVLDAVSTTLDDLHSLLAADARDPGIAACATRAARLAGAITRISRTADEDAARTLEVQPRGFACGMLPFDISERFAGIVAAHASAWIFTSATLSVGENFSHFAARLGVAGAATLRIESPFDFARQALLHLPPGLPEPSSPQHTAAVVETANFLIDAAGGGAFVLFTSHRALARGAALMRASGRQSLLVQGEAPREQLLKDFREHGHAVLLGTASFWEGVDVKGAALRLVIIEKLPFASPDDPIVKARIAHLNARGENAFRDYQLPEAALALKQGVGRLIRSEDDYGAVVICDPRLTQKSYGRVLLASLPPFRRVKTREEVAHFFAERGHAESAARSPAASLIAGP